MLTILLSVLGIIITIFLIVGIHEFGHFIVAKLCGIKVLTFSIGFGKSFAKWHDKQGTEYVLAYIPLGGYVRMLDESEAPVPDNEKKYAYNRQPIYKKIAVIVAGPLFNFLFAFLLYWCLFVIGFVTIAPVIGNVTPNSIAAQAQIQPQDEIQQIDNKPTRTWIAVIINILMHAGDNTSLSMQVKNSAGGSEVHQLNLKDWQLDNLRPDPLKSIGIAPYEPTIPNVIGKVLPNSPAAKAGLKPGDKVISIANKPVKDWLNIIDNVSIAPLQTLNFTVIRSNHKIVIPVVIGKRFQLFSSGTGYLGMSPDFIFPKNLLLKNKYGPIDAFYYAWQDTLLFLNMNFIVLKKIILGKISLASLGGPITIFESAGNALNNGIMAFMSFLAFLSISIGVINILPVPGLDGGHLLMQSIEAIIRRPLPEKIQIIMYKLGLFLLIFIMFQALMNDILRL